MKKILFLVLLSLSLTPVFSHAFSSYEEIDAYYNNQQQQIKDIYNAKIQKAENNLENELNAIDKKYEALTWEVYKDIYGDNFEKVKPFLPESHPDPEVQAKILLILFPEDEALRAVKDKNVSIMRTINPDLADKVQAIIEKYIQDTVKGPAIDNLVNTPTISQIKNVILPEKVNSKETPQIKLVEKVFEPVSVMMSQIPNKEQKQEVKQSWIIRLFKKIIKFY